MCCMAVMGVFSFGVLHTKAAVICDHTVLQSELDIERGYSYEASGHYKVYGTKLSCPRCNYTRWENEYKVFAAPHRFSGNICVECYYVK